MTLKEELSLDRKNAIAEQDKLQREIEADKEMSRMIEDYINPLIRWMHEENRTQKRLTVVMIPNLYGILIYPIPTTIYTNNKLFKSEFCYKELAEAATRVGEKFNFSVDAHSWINECHFTMVLDD